MKKQKTKFRTLTGDLTLPFFGFILVSALTIASLTGLSQYNIVSSKVNKSIEEAQIAAQNYVQDKIPDSAMIGTISPETQLELNNARTIGINAAISSLDSKTEAFLIDRNSPGETLKVFDTADSFVRAGSDGRVEVQFGVDAKIISSLPIQYQRKTTLISAKPSSFAADNCLELACPTGNCGACGACDSCTGKCVPNFAVPDGEGGFEIPDTENATSDNIACQVEVDQCEEIGPGWVHYEEAGLEGCIDSTGKCKFIEDYQAWYAYQVGGFFSNPVSDFFVQGNRNYRPNNNIQPDHLTEHCYDDFIYTRGPEVPFSNHDSVCPSFFFCANPEDLNPIGEKSHAICEHDDSEYSFKTFFTTRGFYNGDLESDALTRYGYDASSGRDAADYICTRHATIAGLGAGPWRAALNGSESTYDSSSGTFTVLDNSQDRIDSRLPGDTKLKNTAGEVISRCDLWNTGESLSAQILDEYGVYAAFNTKAWTGARPSNPHHAILETIISGWIGYTSQTCGDWTGYDPLGNASSINGDYADVGGSTFPPYYWFTSNRGFTGYIIVPGNNFQPNSSITECHNPAKQLRLYCYQE